MRLVVRLLLLLCAPVSLFAQARQEFTAVHMGVQVRIVLYAPSVAVGRAAARAAFGRIAELDDKMSAYRPSSEVRRLSGRPGEWQAVSRDLLHVLLRARELSDASGGAFDVTVGPLVQLWRVARDSGHLPDSAALAEARARSGRTLMEIDSARSQVRLAVPGMQIDLGGIAKGYILHQGLESLRANGVNSAMIEAGGDVVVGAAPPRTAGWSILIFDADSAVRSRSNALANVAIATSGGSEQFVEIDGVRYSHVIDPRTGLGVTGSHIVTVIARDAALADALATAFSVLGPAGVDPLKRRYPDALVALRSGDQPLREPGR